MSITQTLRVMKLTALLLTVLSLHVMAKTAAQTISYEGKDVSLKTVFAEIKKQTHYYVLYNAAEVAISKKVSVSAKDEPLAAFLTRFLSEQGLKFRLVDNTIVISPKEKSAMQTTQGLNPGLIMPEPPPPVDVRGRVIDSTGAPLIGASVRVKGTHISVATNENGEYELKGISNDAVLVFSFVGYGTKEEKVNSRTQIGVILKVTDKELAEVAIQSYSNGFQQLPKERVTGSFEFIDNKTFNKTVSTDILSKLNGIANSMYFKPNGENPLTPDNIIVRGLATLNASSAPLVVIDNFPYVGQPDGVGLTSYLSNLNPNDIESITILKDAAAASIWGAKSGNGVIVIKTKKGQYNKPFQLSLTSNLSIQARPDLYSDRSRLSTNDYADIEQFLYSKGAYNSLLTAPNYPAVSPLVQILADQSAGLISSSVAQSKIDSIRKIDNVSQLNEYYYRPVLNQQYSISLTGGGPNVNYLISGGYDRNLSNIKNNEYERKTLHSVTAIKPIKNLNIEIGIDAYSTTQNNDYNRLPIITPYTLLADQSGNPLTVNTSYSQRFKDTAGGGKLLDWNYKPLSEWGKAVGRASTNDIQVNLNLGYSFLKHFNAAFNYRYERSVLKGTTIQSEDSYYMRNMINQFTQGYTGGDLSYPVPIGGLYKEFDGEMSLNNFRTTLSYNNSWKGLHELAILGGMEIDETKNVNTEHPEVYGYDNNTLSFQTIDYLTYYNYFDNVGSGSIGYSNGFSETLNRFVSFFSNASYSFKGRYVVSASFRKDQSNLFGANTNLRGRPFISTGVKWKISDEQFYKSNLIPLLTLRASFGSQGNVDNRLSALSTIILLQGAILTRLPYAAATNPNNPDLRWEKVSQFNIGIDFGFKKSIISGSIEYYNKNAVDLLAPTPINYLSGFSIVTRNVGGVRTQGIDMRLSARWLNRNIKWNTILNLNFVRTKVTQYLLPVTNYGSLTVSSGTVINPIVGHDPTSLYSFNFGGLDAGNGDPQGYISHQLSKNYQTLVNPTSIDDLAEQGTGRPPLFGSILNSISWKGFTLFANIRGCFNYLLRKSTVSYSTLYSANGILVPRIGSVDYNDRWQNPGDERTTTVPSAIYPSNSYRDQFYAYSTATVIKGDFIRLQNINLSYEFDRAKFKSKYFRNLNIYCSINNLGLLWVANKDGIDPESPNQKVPPTVSLGFTANF